MERFILQLGIMSLQASAAIMIVFLVRVIFRKLNISPKYSSLLWVIPYLCMICPWKFESSIGVWRQPRSNTLKSMQQIITQVQYTQSGTYAENAYTVEAAGLVQEAISSAGNTDFTHTKLGATAIGNILKKLVQSTSVSASDYVSNADVVRMLLDVAGLVWILGLVGLVFYSVLSHLRLQRILICCARLSKEIYSADDISTPFVLGIWRPRIYIPSGMQDETLKYVIAHEKTHIRRKDPLKKIMAFGITCLHWFNPLAWAAFYLFSKDMEMACDEETVRKLGTEHRQNYAEALLILSSTKRIHFGAPLAFNEGNVKDRIKNIVRYKKTWKILSALAIILIAVLLVCFMTKEEEYVPMSKAQDMAQIPREETTVCITADGRTKELSAKPYFAEVSEFLSSMEVDKVTKSFWRGAEYPDEVRVELGVARYSFSADFTAVWSDNDVKESFVHQIKEPEKAKAFFERLLTVESVENGEFTIETLQELIEAGELERTMQIIPLEEKLLYTNFVKRELEASLTYCYQYNLLYEGKEYILSAYYWKPETAQKYGYEENELDSVNLYYPMTGDMVLLYATDEKYIVGDLQEFLSRDYDINHYFSCELPEGTWLGDFKVHYNDIFSGCPILGDFEEAVHGEYATEAWYVPGGMYIGINDANNDIMQFENGRAVSVRWLGNHMGLSSKGKYLSDCEMQALLYEASFELFTAGEFQEYAKEHNIPTEDLKSESRYWYVFMGEEDSEYIYIVCLNQKYFTQEEVIELAQSVKISER